MLEMKCHRCGADNPPTDKYCGQCGSPLEGPSKRQGTAELVGWLIMVSGLIVLALTALYFVLATTVTLWSTGWGLLVPLNDLFYNISGDGVRWSGLTVGVLLGALGAVIYAWPQIKFPGAPGKGIRALMLIGGTLLVVGAIFGLFPWEIARSYGISNFPYAMGIYSHNYLALVLSGLTCILAGAIWAGWRVRRWNLPSFAASSDNRKTGEGGPH
jgi:predicted nucleic acid-binding Zn ribbon protein